MLVANFPKPRSGWVVGNALKHQRRRTIGQWAINNIAMTCNPTNISRAPIVLAFLVIKYILVGHGCINHIAACGAQNAFWLPGWSGCIENKHWVFGIHFFWITCWKRCRGGFFIVDITTIDPSHITPSSGHHKYGIHTSTYLNGFVGVGF